jgi:hypothetical protein
MLAPFRRDKDLGSMYEAVSIAGLDGIVFASSDPARPGTNLADRAYIQKALAGEKNVGAAVISKVWGNPVTPIAASVRSDKLILSINFLDELVTGERVGSHGYVFVSDKADLVIADPKKEKILEQKLLETPGGARNKDGGRRERKSLFHVPARTVHGKVRDCSINRMESGVGHP